MNFTDYSSLGIGVGGNQRRTTTSPTERTQFQGTATWTLPSTKSAGGSATKMCVQVQESVSTTVSWTVPRSRPSGRMTGKSRIRLTSLSTIEGPRYEARNQVSPEKDYFPRFLWAFKEGRSFSAPLPLLYNPRPRLPALVFPLKARPRWLLPSAIQPNCLSALIAG